MGCRRDRGHPAGRFPAPGAEMPVQCGVQLMLRVLLYLTETFPKFRVWFQVNAPCAFLLILSKIRPNHRPRGTVVKEAFEFGARLLGENRT